MPAIHVAKTAADDFSIGCSRLGGLPDVPPAFVWPRWKDRPLGFLGQFRCEELAELDAAHLLPSSGILYFFYDFKNQPPGYDPKDQGGAIVQYVEHTNMLSRASPPDGINAKDVSLTPFRVEFRAMASLPYGDSKAYFKLNRALDDSEFERYKEFYKAVRKHFTADKPCHQLLGNSHTIQGEMQLYCQCVTHGLYCGDTSWYYSSRRVELEPGAVEWRLLFQFDSDDELNVIEYGSMVYFWIRESDLRARQFQRSWTILQAD